MWAILKDAKLYLLLGALVFIAAGSLLLIDRLIMPAYTMHNHGVTVPDITNMNVEDAREKLERQGFRHEVIDRRSHEAFPPDHVVDQNPPASNIVKPNRKIYLTLNTTDSPTVIVPDVTNLSLRNAEIQLQNHGLRTGNITYRSSRFRHSVLEQSISGGEPVERGEVIDLVVSDGLAEDRVEMPDIVGLSLTEGQQKLRDEGLRIGAIRFEGSAEHDPNTILSFEVEDEPQIDQGNQIYEGSSINLIVSEITTEEEEVEPGAIMTDTTDTAGVDQDNVPPDSLNQPDNQPPH